MLPLGPHSLPLKQQSAEPTADNGSPPNNSSPTVFSKRASGVGGRPSNGGPHAETLLVQEDAADAASMQSASLEFSLLSSGADFELEGTKRTAATAVEEMRVRSRRRQNRLETSLGNGTLGSPTAAEYRL